MRQKVLDYVKYRDQNIDHQLFGAFENHRDLLIMTTVDFQDLGDLHTHFRKLMQVVVTNDILVNVNKFNDYMNKNTLQIQPIFLIAPDVQKSVLQLSTPLLIFNDEYLLNFNYQQKADGIAADPTPLSNRQVSTLFESKTFVYLFTDWLKVRCYLLKRTDPRVIEDFIFDNKFLNDEQFFLKLYRFIFRKERPQPKILVPPNSGKRQEKRVQELKRLVSNATNILDIGCSDGFMVEQFGEAFQLQKENIFGMDIRPPVSQRITFIENSAEYLMESQCGKFDLITICMTLHHIIHYKKALTNIYKYLQNGGKLYIREHDAYNNQYKLLLDIHDQAFNSAIGEFPEAEHQEFVQHCNSWFLSKTELRAACEELGFTYVSSAQDDGKDWDVHGRVYQTLFIK